MDATALRWVLAIIGIICIAAIYGYSAYQSKLRRRAAVKTFTHEEIESGFIEDETLRQELAHINTMLDKDLTGADVSDISIHPGLQSEPEKKFETTRDIQLPGAVCDLLPDQRIVHILKPFDDRLLTAEELRSAFSHTGFQLDADFRYHLEDHPEAQLHILNLSSSGSFENINDEQFTTKGMICCIEIKQCDQPLASYEIMLRKIDELVRILELKVYSQDMQLLTLQNVTDIRKKLLTEYTPAGDGQ